MKGMTKTFSQGHTIMKFKDVYLIKNLYSFLSTTYLPVIEHFNGSLPLHKDMIVSSLIDSFFQKQIKKPVLPITDSFILSRRNFWYLLCFIHCVSFTQLLGIQNEQACFIMERDISHSSWPNSDLSDSIITCLNLSSQEGK